MNPPAAWQISLLREPLDGAGTRVGHTVIGGPIEGGRAGATTPNDVATDVWSHHIGEPVGYPIGLRLR